MGPNADTSLPLYDWSNNTKDEENGSPYHLDFIKDVIAMETEHTANK